MYTRSVEENLVDSHAKLWSRLSLLKNLHKALIHKYETISFVITSSRANCFYAGFRGPFRARLNKYANFFKPPFSLCDRSICNFFWGPKSTWHHCRTAFFQNFLLTFWIPIVRATSPNEAWKERRPKVVENPGYNHHVINRYESDNEKHAVAQS